MTQTSSYFDSRPDSRFFMVDVDGVVVSVRQNLPTYAVTDGEVWIACRIHDRCVERRFATVEVARHDLSRFVRDLIGARADAPTIGAWIAIRRAEYAVACPSCGVEPARSCLDEAGAAMLARRGTAIVVGAPWQPDPHEVELDLSPLVHAGRITAHHRSLRGAGQRSGEAGP